MPCPYRLEIDASDVRAIEFAGNRYGWSFALLPYASEGVYGLSESDAWNIADEVESDLEGNHRDLPLLASESSLAKKIWELVENIV